MSIISQMLLATALLSFFICFAGVLFITFLNIRLMKFAQEKSPKLSENAYFGKILERPLNAKIMNQVLSEKYPEYVKARNRIEITRKICIITFFVTLVTFLLIIILQLH